MNPGQTVNVLLVDDEAEFLAAMAKAIARRGLSVLTASGADEARAIFRSHRIDVAVLDVRMPDGDGHDLFYEFKSASPGTQVIMLTGHGDMQKACELGSQGVFDYLSKPCDPELLIRRIQDAAGLSDMPSPGERPLGTEGIRVFLVDDEVDFLTATKRVLARRGLLVEVAGDGEGALEAIRAWRPDVAVVDLKMPGMSGLDLLCELKKLDPHLEVIVLTGHATVDTALDCMKQGAFDYLLKPCSPDELAEKILFAAERRKGR